MRGGDAKPPATSLDAEAGHTGEGFGVRKGVELSEDLIDFFHIYFCLIISNKF